MAAQYLIYVEGISYRWAGIGHDRNAFMSYAMRMGMGIRQGDLLTPLKEFFAIRSWPPLHQLLVAIVITLFGPNLKLVILPSLLAFGGTAIFCFLLARRLALEIPNIAGIVAASIVLSSPAHRVFATDVMLESLGAFLSVLLLYTYVVWRENLSPGTTRWFAILLTFSFLEKYNYWLLVVISIIAAEVITHRRLIPSAIDLVRQIDWKDWMSKQLVNPLNYILFGLTVYLFFMIYSGGGEFEIFGQKVRTGPKALNLWSYCLYVLLLRLLLSWREECGIIWGWLPKSARILSIWHGLPILIWLIYPKRLGLIAWFLGPMNSSGPRANFGESLRFYGDSLMKDYHLSV